jgi:hypothetical protein
MFDFSFVNCELWDVRVVLGLMCLLFMLVTMHSCIKFVQSQDVYVCDYVTKLLNLVR